MTTKHYAIKVSRTKHVTIPSLCKQSLNSTIIQLRINSLGFVSQFKMNSSFLSITEIKSKITIFCQKPIYLPWWCARLCITYISLRRNYVSKQLLVIHVLNLGSVWSNGSHQNDINLNNYRVCLYKKLMYVISGETEFRLWNKSISFAKSVVNLFC